jgi:hypothetical protein
LQGAAAAGMNFNTLFLALTCRDGSNKILSWKKNDEEPQKKNIMQMIIPVSDRRVNSALELKVNINTDGSIESAGRRARLFNRLLEEYSVAQLVT